jgi:chromosome partitioning protein
MKKIAVINQKGGSGKSTLAALIALTLAGDGHRILALDGDPQGALTALFEAGAGPGLFDILVGSTAEPVHVRGIDLLRADHRLDKIVYTLPPFELKKVIKNYNYDFVVIDCPPTVQGVSRAAALAADIVIIPADISRTTFGATLYTLKEIEKAGRVFFIGREPKPNAMGYQAELYREFKAAVKRHYAGTIPRTVSAQKAAAGLVKVPASIAEIIRGELWKKA